MAWAVQCGNCPVPRSPRYGRAASLGCSTPSFGFADAFNLQIAHAPAAGIHRAHGPGTDARQARGSTSPGLLIDQGPMLALIDNYLRQEFVTGLF